MSFSLSSSTHPEKFHNKEFASYTRWFKADHSVPIFDFIRLHSIFLMLFDLSLLFFIFYFVSDPNLKLQFPSPYQSISVTISVSKLQIKKIFFVCLGPDHMVQLVVKHWSGHVPAESDYRVGLHRQCEHQCLVAPGVQLPPVAHQIISHILLSILQKIYFLWVSI